MGIAKDVQESRERKDTLEAIRKRSSYGWATSTFIGLHPLETVKLIHLALKARDRLHSGSLNIDKLMDEALVEKTFNKENLPSVMRTLIRHSEKGFDSLDLVDIAVVGARSKALDPKNLPKTMHSLEKALAELRNSPERDRYAIIQQIIKNKVEDKVLSDENIVPALTELIEHSKAGVDPVPILLFTAKNPEKAEAIKKIRPQLVKTIGMIPTDLSWLTTKHLEEEYKHVLPIIAQVLKTYNKRPKGLESDEKYWDWIRFSAKQLRSVKSIIK